MLGQSTEKDVGNNRKSCPSLQCGFNLLSVMTQVLQD